MPAYRDHYKIFIAISFAAFLFFASTISFAEENSDRDSKIQKVLECAAMHADLDKNVRWADVCYSMGDPVPSGDGREELIDSELRRAEAMAENPISPEPIQSSAPEPVTVENDFPQYDDEQEPRNFTRLGEVDSEKFHRIQFEFAPEVYFYKYTEVIGVKFSGMKYGIATAATLRLSENQGVKSIRDIWSDENKINMFRFEGRYSFGEPDYKSGSGKFNNIPDHNFEFRLLAGYDIPATSATIATPYIGLGYRYLYNGFSKAPPSSGVLSGYDRESNYIYLPLGIDIETKLNPTWTISGKAEIDWLLLGKQVSHLEDSRDSGNNTAGYDVLTNDQKNGMGTRFSIRVKKSGERCNFYIEPYVRYWHIQTSTIDTSCGSNCFTGLEPDNKTWEIGTNAGVQF